MSVAALGRVRLPQRQQDKLALLQESMGLRRSRQCSQVLPLASAPVAQLRWALSILYRALAGTGGGGCLKLQSQCCNWCTKPRKVLPGRTWVLLHGPSSIGW